MKRAAVVKRAILFGLVLLALGCDETPRTQVMVFVRAEPGVMTRGERLDVSIRAGEAGRAREERSALLYTDAASSEGFPLQWPVRIALVPEAGDASRTYEIVATVSDADGAFSRARVVSGYLDRETLTLDVWLRDDCVGELCGDGQTCVAGACADVRETDPCALLRLDGGRSDGCPALDASVSRDGGGDDAGPADGGLDAGVDAGLDGGLDEDAGVDGGPPDPLDVYNVAFVTSTTHPPESFGGIEGAHAVCQMRAAAAGLADPESYRALLPTTAQPAVMVLGAARGWVRMDGRPFADEVRDLQAREQFYPLAFFETGGRIGGIQRVTTAMGGDLGRASGTCGDWTGGGFLDAVGWAGHGPDVWVNRMGAVGCGDALHLYCFGTSRAVPVEIPPRPDGSGVAFVTEGQVAPLDGLAAFDALCRTEGGDPSYKALVAPDDTTSALSRFSFTGPWYRPDDVLVAESQAAIASGQLEAPIAVTIGALRTYGNHPVWTGAPGAASTANRTCAGWTSDADTATIGETGLAGLFQGNTARCNASRRVVCLSDGPIALP